MEIENHIELLNNHVEKIIVKSNNETINALERLRVKYLAKIELIDLQIKKAEQHFLNNLSNEFYEAKPIELVVKKIRGRPRKVYPVIMPEIIINEVSVDTYEVQLEPIIVIDVAPEEVIFNDNIESEFSV